MAAGVLEMKVVGSLRLPKIVEARLRSHDASMVLCVITTWSRLSVLGKGMSSCSFKGKGMVLPSMRDAHLDMVCQSLAALPFAFAEPASGLQALPCVNRGLGMLERVKGIRLEAAQ